VATDLAVVSAIGDALAGPGKIFTGVGARPDAAANANPPQVR